VIGGIWTNAEGFCEEESKVRWEDGMTWWSKNV
jgi:hypothetical protein